MKLELFQINSHRMDSKARRLLWNDVISLIREKRIVIFTSHSMEECETLCNRLAIMVNGQFQCLGTPGYLKNKYGIGYTVTVELEDEIFNSKLTEFVKEKFEGVKFKLNKTKKNSIEFIIPLNSCTLSDLFKNLESNRRILRIVEYSINQNTLDELFLNFAKNKD